MPVDVNHVRLTTAAIGITRPLVPVGTGDTIVVSHRTPALTLVDYTLRIGQLVAHSGTLLENQLQQRLTASHQRYSSRFSEHNSAHPIAPNRSLMGYIESRQLAFGVRL